MQSSLMLDVFRNRLFVCHVIVAQMGTKLRP